MDKVASRIRLPAAMPLKHNRDKARREVKAYAATVYR